jgi:uncharacterized membrane protein (DUF106 family)
VRKEDKYFLKTMDFKINMGTIVTSVLGAAIIGGFTGFWTVSQNTLVNTKDVEKLKEDVKELKQNQDKQETILYEILREVKK